MVHPSSISLLQFKCTYGLTDAESKEFGMMSVKYSVCHSLYAYFDRDNVALNGLSKFFKEASEEEGEHAEKLMKYQNKRGGKVIMYHIKLPPTEFDHIEKGDALYAMELALSLENLTNEKLLKVHVADENNDPQVADENNDPQMVDFVLPI